MRLNRYLAASGVASRRAAEALILGGRVRVNGEVVLELATFVNPRDDRVEVDGKRVAPPPARSYLLLHKPAGTVTTAHDPEGRPTVMALVPRTPRVFPVGRLDADTVGALLMTDDGDLAHRVQHPRYRLDKEYEVLAEGTLAEASLDELRTGLLLEGERRPTAPATVTVLERRTRRTRLRMVIHEGRNRQIRRMLEAVGHPVLHLARIRIGPVALGDLEPGTYRDLTPAELAALRRELGGGRKRRGRGR
jgi:23S rRNA pseudouridine2605 synthase